MDNLKMLISGLLLEQDIINTSGGNLSQIDSAIKNQDNLLYKLKYQHNIDLYHTRINGNEIKLDIIDSMLSSLRERMKSYDIDTPMYNHLTEKQVELLELLDETKCISEDPVVKQFKKINPVLTNCRKFDEFVFYSEYSDYTLFILSKKSVNEILLNLIK